MQNQTKLASLLILRDGNKILLTRKCKEPHKGLYTLPSGKVDKGGSPLETAIRETKEEVNVVLDKSDVRQTHLMYRNDESGSWKDYFFVAEKWSGEIKNNEPEKCDDISWFEMDNLPRNLTPFVKSALIGIEKGETTSKFGF